MKVSFGPYSLDSETGELWRKADRVRLAPQPTKILLLLVERAGRLVTREEIKQLLWDQETFVDFDQSLNACIRQIRSALNDNADKPAFVETLPRRGYRFIAAVTDLPASASLLPQGAGIQSTPQPIELTGLAPGGGPDSLKAPGITSSKNLIVGLQSTERPRESTRKMWLPTVAGVALTVVAIVIGSLYYRFVHRASVQASTKVTSPLVPARTSLAVLCFQNKKGCAQDAWISSALAEMLTSEMSSDDRVRVIPSEDVVQARKDLGLVGEADESRADLGNLRQSLGTDLFVSGSYVVTNTASAPTLEVQVRVQDLSTGRERTKFVQSGELSNLYGLVNDSAKRLRSELLPGQRIAVDDPHPPGGLSSNQKAVRYYTEGLDLYRNYDDQGARGLFELAIEADPDFALAHSMLAKVWSDLNYMGRAEMEAAEAVRLSANLPRVQKLSIEASYHETKYEYDQAITIYKALWTFYPDDAEWGLMLANAQDEAELDRGTDMGAYATLESVRKLPLTPRQEAEVDLVEAEHYADTVDLLKHPETVTEARVLLAAAVQIAQKQKSQLIMGTTLRAKCLVLMKSNAMAEGTEACSEARSIFAAAGNRSAVASETDNMAVAAQRQGDLKGAAASYEEARRIFHETGSVHDEMSMASNIANIQRVLGDQDAEVQAAQDMIRSHDTGSDAAYHWQGNLNLAEVLLQKAELKSATEAALASANAVFSEKPSKSDEECIAASKELLGHLSLAVGNQKGAERYFAESLAIRKEGADPEALAESSMAQAVLHLNRGHVTESAANSLRDAAALFAKDVDAPPYQMNAEVQLARVELALGKTAEAAKAINDAKSLHGKGDWPEVYLDLQLAAAQVEVAQGKDATAIETLVKEVDQSHSSGYVLRQMQGQIALARLQLKTIPTAATTLARLAQKARQLGLLRLAMDASNARS